MTRVALGNYVLANEPKAYRRRDVTVADAAYVKTSATHHHHSHALPHPGTLHLRDAAI